ncbi:flagellar assembly protein FliW [Desulforegula conservatrix]|uniref:flagellar assembly protein FliW n=1 Tax=Desulforegula conservatrix TaxID=153026 RepID=UPI00041559A1|nr:flagellar assembly protein FliW [Desulforegula conservatrix]
MKSEKPSPDALLDNGNNQNKTILFPNGIPGFEDLKTFRLLKEPLNPSVFILQSVEKPDLNIPVVLPHTFGISYDIELSDEETSIIEAGETSEIIVFLVLAKDSEEKKTEKNKKGSIVANIAGPVVINIESMRGYQKILTAMDYNLNIQS